MTSLFQNSLVRFDVACPYNFHTSLSVKSGYNLFSFAREWIEFEQRSSFGNVISEIDEIFETKGGSW